MATQEQLQVWLTAAEAARHDLMIGVREVSISSSSGKSVSYAAADAGKLDSLHHLAAAPARPVDEPTLHVPDLRTA